MRHVFLVLCLCVNFCHSLEAVPTSEQTNGISSRTYLQAGQALKVVFDGIEEQFPDYKRLGMDIQELESSEQLLLECGMDVFEYETELTHLKVRKQNLYITVIDQEIKKIDMIEVLISQIKGLRDSQARLILDSMGIGE